MHLLLSTKLNSTVACKATLQKASFVMSDNFKAPLDVVEHLSIASTPCRTAAGFAGGASRGGPHQISNSFLSTADQHERLWLTVLNHQLPRVTEVLWPIGALHGFAAYVFGAQSS
jgi:hypothetical protein